MVFAAGFSGLTGRIRASRSAELDPGLCGNDDGGEAPLWLLMLLWLLLLIFRPVVCAEHHSSWRHEPARVFAPGEAGCRSVHRQARDGLSMDPATSEKRRAPAHRASSFRDEWAQTPGHVSLVTFCASQKVTRRRRKTSSRRQEDPARAQAHVMKFQSCEARSFATLGMTAKRKAKLDSRPRGNDEVPPPDLRHRGRATFPYNETGLLKSSVCG